MPSVRETQSILCNSGIHLNGTFPENDKSGLCKERKVHSQPQSLSVPTPGYIPLYIHHIALKLWAMTPFWKTQHYVMCDWAPGKDCRRRVRRTLYVRKMKYQWFIITSKTVDHEMTFLSPYSFSRGGGCCCFLVVNWLNKYYKILVDCCIIMAHSRLCPIDLHI